MQFPMIGNISSAIKTMELTQKWMKKKDEIGPGGLSEKNTISSSSLHKKEQDQAALNMIETFKKQVEDQRKSGAINEISSKMKAGQDLTPAELDYLKENAPDLYEKYMEIQKERDQYKKELDRCRTKEDVRNLNSRKMNQFMNETKSVMNSSMPRDAKLAAIQDIQMRTQYICNDHAKFVGSAAYEELPENREELEEEREKDDERKKVGDSDEDMLEKMEQLKDALDRLTDKLKEEREAAMEAQKENAEANAQDAQGAQTAESEGTDENNSDTRYSGAQNASSSGASNSGSRYSGAHNSVTDSGKAAYSGAKHSASGHSVSHSAGQSGGSNVSGYDSGGHAVSSYSGGHHSGGGHSGASSGGGHISYEI